MDFLAELLPQGQVLKSGSSSKDKRQKSGYSNSASQVAKDNLENANVEIETKVAVSEWKDVDRRTGKDRRKQMAKRGRWLESRDRNDRRASEFEIFVKI